LCLNIIFGQFIRGVRFSRIANNLLVYTTDLLVYGTMFLT